MDGDRGAGERLTVYLDRQWVCRLNDYFTALIVLYRGIFEVFMYEQLCSLLHKSEETTSLENTHVQPGIVHMGFGPNRQHAPIELDIADDDERSADLHNFPVQMQPDISGGVSSG